MTNRFHSQMRSRRLNVYIFKIYNECDRTFRLGINRILNEWPFDPIYLTTSCLKTYLTSESTTNMLVLHLACKKISVNSSVLNRG